uniref:Translocation and assembly module TamB C-terminal domain-containing protein n=1 Tax=Opuntia streptacantha TaxID=393608 RepID=A0A7C9DJI0_OPUST
MVATRYMSRFFGSEPAASNLGFSQSSGKQAEVVNQTEQANKKPNVDVRLNNLKLVLGPELRIVYPLILNFAVSGELELNGVADPKLIKPKGVLTFENGDVNLVATQIRLKREHLNVAKFEPDNGLDPTLDLALVGSEWQFRIQGRASNWQEKLVVTSTRSVQQDVLSPTEAARVFESQLAKSILEGDGQLALEKLATATLETLMPRIEGKGEFGQARWRLVYAPQIPSLLSVDPTVDPLKSLASNISFGTEVEVQLGKRLQASIVRQMKDSEMAMQWTLIYQLTSRLRVLLQSAPSKRLLFEYSTTSQD